MPLARRKFGPTQVLVQVAVDVAVLPLLIGWSDGAMNSLASLFPPLETRPGLTYDGGDWTIGAPLRGAITPHRIAVDEGKIVGKDLGPTRGFGVFS